jgi:hypothetical protein|tara:strand:- start:349 stop:594 length:246 start_codon:yes stop_codon:yes gene_type:complete
MKTKCENCEDLIPEGETDWHDLDDMNICDNCWEVCRDDCYHHEYYNEDDPRIERLIELQENDDTEERHVKAYELLQNEDFI